MKNKFSFFIVFCFSLYLSSAFSQILNLPPRDSGALTGSQFVTTISSGSMNLTTRENLIFTEISNGNVPDFYRILSPVTSLATISGITQSATYYVIPDYLAIGCDSNYFLCPMSPMLASQIGILTGCTLPTRKMANDIWTAATVKLAPSTISPGPGMTTVPVFNQHNSTVNGQRQFLISTFPLGELVGGDKKDIVISNQIYATANRVVIYGWHQTNGSAIQPLSNVHSDTYMDYSHGIRLIQNNCMLNGSNSTTVQSILQSPTLNPILSDEGQLPQPYYPYNQPVTQLSTPVSFAVLQNTSTSIKIKVTNDVNVSDYKVYTSSDGLTFNAPLTLAKSNLVVNGLSSTTICYIKIAAFNATYSITSPISEVLAAVTSLTNDSVLIVNAFDRAASGNTFNFVVQHGTSFYNNQVCFESASNEAITNGLISLNDYKTVDYILGKESSVNETFSGSEQTLVSDYLKQGGHLFVSGSEIAWDLDHLGSATDKIFFQDYLKSSYVADAPNNAASIYFKAFSSTLSSSIFNTIDSILFDNGTNGTYNVDYPDVISPVNGSISDFHYATNPIDIAGIHFQGLFTGGSKAGKLVYLCFPFETIYNQIQRDSVMSRIIYFFDNQEVATANENIENTKSFELKIFPNPLHTTGTIYLTISKQEEIAIDLFDILGEKVFAILNQTLADGEYVFPLNRNELTSGIYLLSAKTKSAQTNIRIVISD